MSIEIIIHPQGATRENLVSLLRSFGFEPTESLRKWPAGSFCCHWFKADDFESFDGVEATVFSPTAEEQSKLGKCAWAVHTRTRYSASPADKEQQNLIIRTIRARYGGKFYNDWFGTNRYTKVDPDRRDAAARGIYLAYEYVSDSLRAVRFALPEPDGSLEKLSGTDLNALAAADPTRVLYNALVPFAVATLEHFFSRCFKILLHYDQKAQARLRQQTRKIDLPDVLAIQSGSKTVEDVVADWYSFQNIASIHSAFFDWFGIDVWKLLRRRRRIGKRFPVLEKRLDELIQVRHGIVHRLAIDRDLTRKQTEQLLDLALAIVDTLVDHLEATRGLPIRD